VARSFAVSVGVTEAYVLFDVQCVAVCCRICCRVCCSLLQSVLQFVAECVLLLMD